MRPMEEELSGVKTGADHCKPKTYSTKELYEITKQTGSELEMNRGWDEYVVEGIAIAVPENNPDYAYIKSASGKILRSFYRFVGENEWKE